eukprot:m.24755 g.24755  ORF g.24755 m.24755 type:complete len:104 (-) comp14739_c0_seq1:163-474(-)
MIVQQDSFTFVQLIYTGHTLSLSLTVCVLCLCLSPSLSLSLPSFSLPPLSPSLSFFSSLLLSPPLSLPLSLLSLKSTQKLIITNKTPKNQPTTNPAHEPIGTP